jgi:hypothetical protein
MQDARASRVFTKRRLGLSKKKEILKRNIGLKGK